MRPLLLCLFLVAPALPAAAQERPPECTVAVDLARAAVALQRGMTRGLELCLAENGGDPSSPVCRHLAGFFDSHDSAAVTAALSRLDGLLPDLCGTDR